MSHLKITPTSSLKGILNFCEHPQILPHAIPVPLTSHSVIVV